PLRPLLFLYSPRHPPHLPPFPTRRSSDLVVVAGAGGDLRGEETVLLRLERVPAAAELDLDRPRRRRPHARLDAPVPERNRTQRRSEEHTSELQSQSNLVCRLLLEKKKK